jgi:bacterial leucyl aminopeptidase
VLRLRSLLLASVALLGACAEASPSERVPLPLEAPADEVWISTDAEGARVIEALSVSQSRVELPADGLVALRVARDALPVASEAIHEELKRCGGFKLRGSLERARQREPERATLGGALPAPAPYVIDHAAVVNALLPLLKTANLKQTIEDLSAFPDRFHESATGKQASTWIRDQWQGYAAARPDVKVELIEHDETPQPSVSLTIPGKTQPAEQVILGGHLDSINRSGGLAPGADDNASGIAVLSELIRVALELGYQPDRTVVFYGYAAEEIGLVGSDEIAARAEAQQAKIEGILQLDMTNYNPAPEPYMSIVTDFTDGALNDFAKLLIDAYVGIPWKLSECGYACSDHASWTERGFAAHHVHETTADKSNDKIHTAQDTLAVSGGKADHSLYFARYSAAFMVELAKGSVPTPPECAAERPCAGGAACQDGKCVAAVGGSGGMTSATGGGTLAAAGTTASGAAGGAVTGGAAGASSVAGVATAGAPTGIVRAGAEADAGGGCACRTSALPAASSLPWLGLLGLALLRRRASAFEGRAA